MYIHLDHSINVYVCIVQLAVDGKPASRDELKVCQSLAHDESAKKAQKAKTKKKVRNSNGYFC